MNWRNVIIVAVIIVPILIVLALGFGLDPREVPSMMIGKPAPDCRLTSLEGAPLAVSGFRGKPVVLNFWATWCVPCEAEHQLLVQAARSYGARAQFLGVVYQDEAQAARRYLKKKGSAYPQLADPASRCSIDYGVAGVPETFFIDGAGMVRHKETGPVTPDLIRRTLDPLLVGATP